MEIGLITILIIVIYSVAKGKNSEDTDDTTDIGTQPTLTPISAAE
jgi:hypothetical protein